METQEPCCDPDHLLSRKDYRDCTPAEMLDRDRDNSDEEEINLLP